MLKIIHMHLVLSVSISLSLSLYMYKYWIFLFGCLLLLLIFSPGIFFCQWNTNYRYEYHMYLYLYTYSIDGNSTMLALVPFTKRIQAIEPNWLGVNDKRALYRVEYRHRIGAWCIYYAQTNTTSCIINGFEQCQMRNAHILSFFLSLFCLSFPPRIQCLSIMRH